MFRLQEAFTLAKQRGMKVSRRELASLLWPEASQHTRDCSMQRLLKGDAKLIKPEWVEIICTYLDINSQFLFNL